jgi:hypothetical protein
MNAAFDTKRTSIVLSVAELIYLSSLAAKQNESLSNYIRMALGLEPSLIGRPTTHERQMREDQAMVYLRKAGLNDQQVAAYFPDIELPAGRPKPKAETGLDEPPIPTDGPLNTSQLLALGPIITDYNARCTAAAAAGEPKPEPPPEIARYLKK